MAHVFVNAQNRISRTTLAPGVSIETEAPKIIESLGTGARYVGVVNDDAFPPEEQRDAWRWDDDESRVVVAE